LVCVMLVKQCLPVACMSLVITSHQRANMFLSYIRRGTMESMNVKF
jgi:hypothetical protein